MDKTRLFGYLAELNPPALLALLKTAYDEMNVTQRETVFNEVYLSSPSVAMDGKELLKKVHRFYQESMDGEYYAPFDINSKNFMDIPEETEEWFEQLSDLLEFCTTASEQDDHVTAVQCFGLLYKLILTMEDGDEIVFADELGSWMIRGDEKEVMGAYLKSLSVVSSPEEFTKAGLPLIKRDSYSSFADKVYSSASRVANKEQKAYLKSEIKRHGIRTSSSQ